ncbi:hypothetical protein [Caldilinea sp.]|jgi:hypothetical protein|uniref:hypothetical protein n=1 Tax=Caldilinea sp. TaxID=2293560 RepID=UPI001B26980F|nr:hypothetical protein [Caldilinea sp.]MBO9394549.1 hypothetical protein [Caldilinea sp.]
MLNRRIWIVALVAVLLMSMLAGCSMGDVPAPSRNVPISIDAALEGQNAGLMGLMTGEVTWTESQLSSFLTELLKQNTGPNQPVDAITVWLEPGNKVHARITLKEGVLLGSRNIDVAGQIMVQGGKLMVNLASAGANGMMVSGPLMDLVNSYINGALAGFGVAADVSTGEGSITIKVGAM